MNNSKPSNLEEYAKWLKDKHDVEITRTTRTLYESVANKIKADFESSLVWTQLVNSLANYNAEYLVNTGYHLFEKLEPPKVLIKPFDSFVLKGFRKNVVQNPNWPDPPPNGWILPDNWYSKIGDVVRTLFVVKLLDGSQFLSAKVMNVCKQLGLECSEAFEAREEGYYAIHVSVQQVYEIPKFPFDTDKVAIDTEIQVTTQLQEVIRRMLHKYYELRRTKGTGEEQGLKWQWDYKSDEFAANYLGHILHYVEGMIMEIVEKQKGRL